MNNYKWMMYILTVFLSVSCGNSNERTVFLGEYIAQGNISSDTVYNGLIKLYDPASGKLIYEGYYVNGIENGIHKDYYLNGKVSFVRNYETGKLVGMSFAYDSSGKLSFKNFHYFDVPVGPLITYDAGTPKNFSFYSFDQKLLFEINYDSTIGQKITDIRDKFFFYHFYYKTSYQSSIVRSEHLTECFLYLLNPPKYNFKYELVLTDDKYNVKSVLKEFQNDLGWEIFPLKPLRDSTDNKYYALRLTINDSINNLQNVMFKYLPTPY